MSQSEGKQRKPVRSHLEWNQPAQIALRSNPVRVTGWADWHGGHPPDRINVVTADLTIPLSTNIAVDDGRNGFGGTFVLGKGMKKLSVVAEWDDGTRHVLGRKLAWIAKETPQKSTQSPFPSQDPATSRQQALLEKYRRQCGENPADDPKSATIDVIVPVYRGLEPTKACLESLYASKDENLAPFEIVVVNDGSPEWELVEYLQGEAQAGRITLLESEVNHGYAASINKGICLHTKRNVILLHSDTEVYNNWVDRMVASLHSGEKIATATPFSNNGSLCSYPDITERNPVPQSKHAATLDALCSELNHGKAHPILEGDGFCMMVNRKCLDEVGHLDIEAFSQSTGGERDFCQRAKLNGWKNLHICDTYVLHQGPGDLQDSVAKTFEALEALSGLYPDYAETYREAMDADPSLESREKLDRHHRQTLPKQRILCISNAKQGGIPRHINELVEASPTTARFLLSSHEGNPGKFEILSMAGMSRIQFPGHAISLGQIPQFCKDWKIKALEYHNYTGMPEEIINLPETTGLPYTFTAHDYYPLCPQTTLTHPNGTYCGVPSTHVCETCLRDRRVPEIGSVQFWRKQHTEFLQNATQVTAPSYATRALYVEKFPRANIHVTPHETLPPESLPRPQWTHTPGETLRVAVTGALTPEKGADVLEAAALDAARRDLPIQFILIGYPYRALSQQTQSKLKATGPYEGQDLQQLLKENNPHLVWFPAQCPETYSYTLSDTLRMAYPIIAPNLGAFPERLHGRHHTWVVQWDLKPQMMNDQLVQLAKESQG